MGLEVLILRSLWKAIFKEICMAPRFRGLPSPKSVIFPKEIADSERLESDRGGGLRSLEGDRREVSDRFRSIEAPRDALARALYYFLKTASFRHFGSHTPWAKGPANLSYSLCLTWGEGPMTRL